jgi:glycosyltransferase involved in cell wall biosynthesis
MSLRHRATWQRFALSPLAHAAGCDVLFVPGGSYVGDFHPVVTMSRNLLPFELHELARFGWSWLTLRLLLLRLTQSRTFRRADGLIFLTRYANDVVMRTVGKTMAVTTIIPHGIDERFVLAPREQRPISSYNSVRPFRIIYVSIVDMYKHQWCVADAVAKLRGAGLPVALSFVGPAYLPALKRLTSTIRRLDGTSDFLRYEGPISHDELHAWYAEADLCVFASSCENMPNILLEGMASGLPIASSDRGPMPEVLGDGGVYFDPEKAEDIAKALSLLIESPELRAQVARKAFERVRSYSWRRCADETLQFLARVSRVQSARLKHEVIESQLS